MKTFIIHILLAGFLSRAIYRFLGLDDTALIAAASFLVLYTILWLSSYFYHRSYFRKVPRAVSLFLFFIKELVVASVEVAYDIMTLHHYMQPGIIALPLDARTDLEITLLANMISLTPGTLSLDVSRDKTILFVHAMYIKGGNVDEFKQSLKNGFERRLLQIMR